MSRHVLRSDDVYTVVVGYDDPLDSFFAQVYDVAAERAEPDGPEILLVSTGNKPQEVTDPMECVGSVRGYLEARPAESLAELADPSLAEIGTVVVALFAERAHRQEPTEFQRETFRRLLGGELP